MEPDNSSLPKNSNEISKFINKLREERSSDLLNMSADYYLEALAAMFVDHKDHLLSGVNDEKIPYSVLANMLGGACIYE